MLVHTRKILAPEQGAEIRRLLDNAPWNDGRETAGYLSARVKNNLQLPVTDTLARKLAAMVGEALNRSAQFQPAALPLKMVPPLFNRYSGGQNYGDHIGRARHLFLLDPGRGARQ
ncbi:MAG TPA: hypothetical protein VN723_13875 [Rhizomicrobium sp.]|nr:hypothetical protein [Rhizomicrobium sp.]